MKREVIELSTEEDYENEVQMSKVTLFNDENTGFNKSMAIKN